MQQTIQNEKKTIKSKKKKKLHTKKTDKTNIRKPTPT